MRLFKYTLLSVALLVLFFCASVFWATRPLLSETEFKSSDIIFRPEFNEKDPASLPPATIRIATYNIGYAAGTKNNLATSLSSEETTANLAGIAAAIKRINPDVICLQEIDFRAARTFYQNQLTTLAEALHMPYAAYAVTWNKRYVAWPYWPPSAHFGAIVSGQAVLSRFPIVKQETTVFDKPPQNPFWYNWFYLDRVVQKLTLDLGDHHHATLWHVHLDAFSKDTRFQQAQYLAKATASTPTLQWIVGDFNSVSKTKAGLSASETKALEDSGEALTAILSANFLNAEPPSMGLTMPSWDPIKKIDHILYSPDLSLVGGGSLTDVTASDHLPVWAKFKR